MKTSKLLSITILSIIMFSCSNNDCDESQELVRTTSITFGDDSNSTNCNAYKNAWLTHIDNCDAVAGVSREEIDALKCDCLDLYDLLSLASDAYLLDPNMENCQAYRQALQNVVAEGECDDTGSFAQSINQSTQLLDVYT